MQKENREKDKEDRRNQLYSGGRVKELTWIEHIEELIFNQPIKNALWNNEEKSIESLVNPPRWKANYTPTH